jgi:signal transduction histidine kinase
MLHCMASIRWFFLLRCRIETQHNKLRLLGLIRTRSLAPASRSAHMPNARAAGLESNMKPLKSEIRDSSQLQEIGRASVQIVHDLKNQLNGLKLYATFLRKRMEKSERPTDEQETIAKLIAGLERAAADLTALVRLGRPLELRLQPRTDLLKIMATFENGGNLQIDAETNDLAGDFDVAALTEALKTITACATGMRPVGETESLRIHLQPDEKSNQVVIEWRGVQPGNGDDPFHSFAGSEGLRMALAAKIIEAHGGETEHEANVLRIRLPVEQRG